ncbi:dihydrolipoyllysine-residue acetyltransferase [Pseudomonadota bacterium]|nr:dihydrolipoyllysine-residue acetyltransferase [Xanthomonadales bacterium]
MSKTIEIKVPDIGDFRDIPVIEVLVAAGDQVSAEDGLVTLESDKATMEVPSPVAGVIREMRLKLDDTVSEGDVVAILEVADEPAAEAAPSAESAPAAEVVPEARPEPNAQPAPDADETPRAVPVQTPAVGPGPGALESGPAADVDEPPAAGGAGTTEVALSMLPYASPVIRKFARELGVDLTRVSGSGDKGRILREDVSAYVKSVMSAPATAAAPTLGGLRLDFPELTESDFSRYGEIETQPLTRIQKISAGHLHRNWVGIPHVTQHDEADITDMEAFRLANADEAAAQGFKLTPLVFLMKAMVASLKKYPRFNASLNADGETLVLKKYYNIGIAVDTPEGLVVPVIRNCERKGIMELAAELAELSARARDRKLKPQDIQGGCISISSLGGIGGTAFTPIINAPEVAILGVSRSSMKPVWNGKEFNPRLMLPLSLSYDHRVIDGAAAARFTRFLASRLEDLRRLTL